MVKISDFLHSLITNKTHQNIHKNHTISPHHFTIKTLTTPIQFHPQNIHHTRTISPPPNALHHARVDEAQRGHKDVRLALVQRNLPLGALLELPAEQRRKVLAPVNQQAAMGCSEQKHWKRPKKAVVWIRKDEKVLSLRKRTINRSIANEKSDVRQRFVVQNRQKIYRYFDGKLKFYNTPQSLTNHFYYPPQSTILTHQPQKWTPAPPPTHRATTDKWHSTKSTQDPWTNSPVVKRCSAPYRPCPKQQKIDFFKMKMNGFSSKKRLV